MVAYTASSNQVLCRNFDTVNMTTYANLSLSWKVTHRHTRTKRKLQEHVYFINKFLFMKFF